MQGDANSEIVVRGKIRNASSVFVRGTPEPGVIHRSLAELRSSLAWAREHRVTELVNDALWGILKQPSEAADFRRLRRKKKHRAREGL